MATFLWESPKGSSVICKGGKVNEAKMVVYAAGIVSSCRYDTCGSECSG